jgi:hypothetical protein
MVFATVLTQMYFRSQRILQTNRMLLARKLDSVFKFVEPEEEDEDEIIYSVQLFNRTN